METRCAFCVHCPVCAILKAYTDLLFVYKDFKIDFEEQLTKLIAEKCSHYKSTVEAELN